MNVSKPLKKKISDEKTAFFLSILLAIVGTLLISKGIRDMDTALNICIVKMETGVEFSDMLIFQRKPLTMAGLQSLGILEILLSFLTFILALSLMWIIYLNKR
jgi:hypothetical protein